ncbi:MAG TPA: ring-cleaving dioxygenase [Rubrobacter sp.]|nr:ring-cleaving dioxygenase [Rubrobacter sp.]
MEAETSGIHHVTAIGGGPQRNLDFYAGVLGTRLVKRTVNFDDPGTYHLYYGDGGGTPGTIMTFFPWEGAAKGRIGSGQVITTAYSIPEASLGYWTGRLVENGVRFEKPRDQFGDTVLAFEDPDGLRLEIVAADDRRAGYASGPTPAEHSIRGFHHAALAVRDAERTVKLMTDHLGFRRVDEAENRTRLAAGDGGPGNLVDVMGASGFPRGSMGVGTVHHIAFRVPDEETHLAVREEVHDLGLDVTPVLDRNYFKSIYFREPGGVLFEIATDPPGFAADEDAEHLGESLKLPPWLEERRGEIEEVLTPLRIPGKEEA